MSSRSDSVEEKDLEFSHYENRSFALVIPPAIMECGAPSRFLYFRLAEGPLRAGAVHAWVTGGPSGWGQWQEIAFMPYSDEEQIELFMRNAARLGLDEGPVHGEAQYEAST